MIDLRLGDCLDVMRGIPDASIDAVITDPPYALNGETGKSVQHIGRKNPIRLSFGEWDNDIDWDKFYKQVSRILKPNGTIYTFASHKTFGDIFKAMNSTFYRTNFFVWHKPNPAIQIRKTSYLSSCELILWSHGEGHTFNFSNQSDMHNHWEGIYPMGREKNGHPTQKPIALIERFVKTSSNEGDTILDPFMGSGTTGVACVKLNRDFIGIEINPQYYAIAQRRIQEAQAQIALPMVTA